MIKISVIVPVYNVERYLDECLESIINQKIKEIEIICIDDGSKDCSGQILDSYAKSDDRFVIVHKKNAGYGYSVNLGMDISRGKYIAIVEPDDYIELDMFLDLFLIAEKENVEFVKSDFGIFYADGTQRNITHVNLYDEDGLYYKKAKPLDDPRFFQGCIANWTGIYRRDFLKKYKIRHNETPGASFQDQGFNFLVFAYASKVYISRGDYYRYRQDNPNSSIATESKLFCIIDEYKYIYEVLSNSNLDEKAWIPLFYKQKFSIYFTDLNKLGVKYKYKFFNDIMVDLKGDLEKGELSAEDLEEWQSVELEKMIDNGERYFLDEMSRENAVNCIFYSFTSVWIYGAGKIAEQLWTILEDDNKSKVKGFLVTDNTGTNSGFKSVSEYSPEVINDSDIIVIAASVKNSAIIKKKLENDNLFNSYLIKQFL